MNPYFRKDRVQTVTYLKDRLQKQLYPPIYGLKNKYCLFHRLAIQINQIVQGDNLICLHDLLGNVLIGSSDAPDSATTSLPRHEAQGGPRNNMVGTLTTSHMIRVWSGRNTQA